MNGDKDFWPGDHTTSRSNIFTQLQGEEDDGRYRAFITSSQPGAAKSLRLVPAKHTGQPIVRVPYLQPITIEEHTNTKQLCLLCHSSHHVIFIEGDNLTLLAEAIDEKKAKTVYQHDPNQYGSTQPSDTIITKITVESKS